jgi:putative membrane protein
MAGIVIRFCIVALGLWLASEIVTGIHISTTGTLLGAALILGIVNAVVRPIIIIFTLPISIVTLGLFLLVINAGMLGLVAWLFKNFTIDGFWPAFWGAIIIGLTSWAGSAFVGPQGRVEMYYSNQRRF